MPNLSRDGPCRIEGCVRPIHARRLCETHYRRNRDFGDPLRTQRLKLKVIHVVFKRCDGCGKPIMRSSRWSEGQWQRKRCCSLACGNRVKGLLRRQGSYSVDATPAEVQAQWQRRQAMPRWALEWEARRYVEDVADLATMRITYGRGAQPLGQRPIARLFLGHHCVSCPETWVSYAARHDTAYCSKCNTRRWASDCRHKRRARIAATKADAISPDGVFKRDGHRCQICKRKTRGTFPSPRAATLDHIVPLALGGTHTHDNVQCACFECNTRKGRRFLPTQLSLAG